MPRFYMNIRHLADLTEDLEGQHFPSLADAHDDAIVAAREIMADRVQRGMDPDHSQIEITDSAGRLVDTVRFKEAIDVGRPSRR